MPAASAPPDPAAAAWRVTFADLAALLLSFFVLVFSMSAMDAARWTALSSSLVEARLPGDRVPVPPAAQALTAPRQDAVAAAAAADYLYVLLRRRLDQASLLVPVTLTRGPDAVLIRFDADLILQGERPAPTAQGELLIGRLVDLLAPLDNAVTLRVRPAAAGAPAGDRAAGLRAAVAAARTLRAAGFERPLAAHALAPDPAAPATIEILVHQETAGG